VISDPLVIPLALELLECYEQELAKVEFPPAYVHLRPGTQVDHLLSLGQDECCQGLAWVRPADFYPSSTAFPQPDEAPNRQGVLGWAVTLELGAIRCAPTPEPSRIPTGDEWLAATTQVMDDAAAMRRAICCFIDRKRGRAGLVMPGRWVPAPIEGGCVGGVLPVTVRGPACDCPDAGPES
jgi:hypothetical protein